MLIDNTVEIFKLGVFSENIETGPSYHLPLRIIKHKTKPAIFSVVYKFIASIGHKSLDLLHLQTGTMSLI